VADPDKFKELNKLNDLPREQFQQFLLTSEDGAWHDRRDIEHSIQTNSLPLPTISEIVRFFTKEDVGKVLHVFCGTGRVAQHICSPSNMEYTGITLYEEEKKEFKASLQEDMFSDDSANIIVEDAITALEHLAISDPKRKFDFILVDPPRWGSLSLVEKATASRKDIAAMGRTEFIQYVSMVLDLASSMLTEDGFIAALIDDQLTGGEYCCMGFEVASHSRSVKLKGIKRYRFPRNGQVRGNFGRYIPAINENPAYFFTSS